MFQTEQDALWYLNLTTEQDDAFKQLQSELKQSGVLDPAYDSTYTLLRFLKARQWDVPRAVLMYKEMTKFRLEQNVSEIYANPNLPDEKLKALQQCYPHFYHKTDNFGRPIYLELLGKCDPDGVFKLFTVEEFINYRIFMWERLERVYLPACSKAAGKPIVTQTVIVDLEGLSIAQFTTSARKMMSTFSKIDQDQYPEHLGQMFIINAPFIFKTIWAVLNPLLEERTRKKIQVLGVDYQATLLQIVAPENLPTFLGGTSVCTDNSNCGPWDAEAS